MALNRKPENPVKVTNMLGYNNGITVVDMVSKSPDYSFTAFLTQVSNEAPKMHVLYDDTLPEHTFVSTYESSGVYRLHSVIINPRNTKVEINNAQGSAYPCLITAKVHDGYIEINSYDSALSLMDDTLMDTPIKVEVWLNGNVGVLDSSVLTCDNFWIVSFTDPTASSFTGWTLNGYADFDWGNLAASFGGTYILDFSSLSPAFSPPSLATFIYQGPTPPPDLVGTDAFSNPVSYTFTKYCEKKVLQAVTDGLAGPTISNITIAGINLDLLAYGGPVNIYASAVAESVITSALQAYFGPNAYCLIQQTNGISGSPFTIDLFNVYADPVASSTAVGAITMGSLWNADQFDFSSVTNLQFSDISYNALTGLYVCGMQQINWTVPSDFYVNLVVTTTYNYYLGTIPGTNPINLIANGASTLLDPTLNGLLLNLSFQTIRIFNGQFIQLVSYPAAIAPGISYVDTLQIKCPYLGYSILQTIQTTVTY